MTTSINQGDPSLIVDSEALGNLFSGKKLRASDVRNSEEVLNQLRSGEVSQSFLRGIRGLPFYYGLVSPAEELSSPIAFERNFNP